jgi:hypothetical protein
MAEHPKRQRNPTCQRKTDKQRDHPKRNGDVLARGSRAICRKPRMRSLSARFWGTLSLRERGGQSGVQEAHWVVCVYSYVFRRNKSCGLFTVD